MLLPYDQNYVFCVVRQDNCRSRRCRLVFERIGRKGVLPFEGLTLLLRSRTCLTDCKRSACSLGRTGLGRRRTSCPMRRGKEPQPRCLQAWGIFLSCDLIPLTYDMFYPELAICNLRKDRLSRENCFSRCPWVAMRGFNLLRLFRSPFLPALVLVKVMLKVLGIRRLAAEDLPNFVWKKFAIDPLCINLKNMDSLINQHLSCFG